jgi:DNA-binding LacI/PurR family transcriptional regulator
MTTMNIFSNPMPRDLLGVIDTTSIKPILDRFNAENIPCVSFCSIPVHSHTVVADYDSMFEQAIRTMQAHGHHDFALMYMDFADTPHETIADLMIEKDSLLRESAVGFRPDRLVPVPWSLTFGHAYDAFKEWWQRPNRPSAMFFCDDALFDVASRAIGELGIRVPEDLAIITQASSGRRFQCPVQPTRIEFDLDEGMTAAWTMLQKLMRGETIAEQTVLIRPTVVDRDSL